MEVHGWDVNAAPEQTTTPTLTVTEGASGSISVLGNWLDPDGDDLYLVSAQGEGLDVKTSHEGTVTVREMGAGVGTRQMTVVVSDGQQTTSGTVSVDVQAADSATPTANADHVRVVTGSSAVISPLDNDVSPSGAPLYLAGVQEAPTGTSIELDQQAGVLTFSANDIQPTATARSACHIGVPGSPSVLVAAAPKRATSTAPALSEGTTSHQRVRRSRVQGQSAPSGRAGVKEIRLPEAVGLLLPPGRREPVPQRPAPCRPAEPTALTAPRSLRRSRPGRGRCRPARPRPGGWPGRSRAGCG